MEYISTGLGAHTITSRNISVLTDSNICNLGNFVVIIEGNIVLTLVGWEYIRFDMRRLSRLPMHLFGKTLALAGLSGHL